MVSIRLCVQSKPTLTKAGLAAGAAATLDFLLLFPMLFSLFYGTYNSNLSPCRRVSFSDLPVFHVHGKLTLRLCAVQANPDQGRPGSWSSRRRWLPHLSGSWHCPGGSGSPGRRALPWQPFSVRQGPRADPRALTVWPWTAANVSPSTIQSALCMPDWLELLRQPQDRT